MEVRIGLEAGRGVSSKELVGLKLGAVVGRQNLSVDVADVGPSVGGHPRGLVAARAQVGDQQEFSDKGARKGGGDEVLGSMLVDLGGARGATLTASTW